MNTSLLLEKLREKVIETNEYVENTSFKQKKLISTAKELNFKIRNFIEADINQKNSFADAQEKLGVVKQRIEKSKHSINSIKDKIKNLKNKYNY